MVNPGVNFASPKRSWQKHGFKIILSLTAVLLIISGILIYHYYLKTDYALDQLLPQNLAISFELKMDRFTLPKVSKDQFLKNELLEAVYNAVNQEIEQQLGQLPPESQAELKKIDHLILFVTPAGEFGLVAKIPASYSAKKNSQVIFPGWQTAVIKKKFLAISRSQSIIQQLTEQKLAVASWPDFSVTLSPWLNISVSETFFHNQYPSPILTELQNVLWPLALTKNNYSLQFNSGYKFLETVLIPDQAEPTANLTDLASWLDLMPGQSQVILGLPNLADFSSNLESNPNLAQLFEEIDHYLWLDYQISLSNLIKKINGPVLIGKGGDDWRIIAKIENLYLADSYLRSYFGQFQPKKQKITLPDGTMATELISNPEAVTLVEKNINDWTVFIIHDSPAKVGYATKGDLLMIGNNIEEAMSAQKFYLDCFKNNQVFSIFSIKDTNNELFAPILRNFAKINVITTDKGQIKACFTLK